MSTFTEKEVAYLRGQVLGRMATSGATGRRTVVPVGFRVDPEGEAIEIGGFGLRAASPSAG